MPVTLSKGQRKCGVQSVSWQWPGQNSLKATSQEMLVRMLSSLWPESDFCATVVIGNLSFIVSTGSGLSQTSLKVRVIGNVGAPDGS